MMFNAYRGSLPINPCWCKLPLDTCRSGDISVDSCSCKEHDAHDTARFYKDTMRKDTIELGDPHVCVPIQQDSNITDGIAAYNAVDMDKVAPIDKREEERRKWKAYLRTVRKNRAGISKALYS